MSRLTIHLSESTSRVVETLASRLESPPEEVVREALSMWWLARERSADTRFQVERNGVLTELMIPSLDPLIGGPPLEEPVDEPDEQATDG